MTILSSISNKIIMKIDINAFQLKNGIILCHYGNQSIAKTNEARGFRSGSFKVIQKELNKNRGLPVRIIVAVCFRSPRLRPRECMRR